jgi:hypothetical protein
LGRSAPGVFILDIDIPPFMENRAFDLEHVRQYPGAEAGAALGQVLRSAGMETVTADVYLTRPASDEPAVCLSNHLTVFTERLLDLPHVRPAACMSLESPIGALDFYGRILEASTKFEHVFLWGGARERATGGARFHEVHWPYPNLALAEGLPDWDARRFATLISSNKQAFGLPRPLFDVRWPRDSLRRLLTALDHRRRRASEPWFQSELYQSRIDAVLHFSKSGDFDLFGRGWDDTSQLPARAAKAVRSAYRGSLPPLAKVRTLGDYRFAICFENTAFPGYITEKVFDCFVAGCIPVYLGAPDVQSFLPTAAIVDARAFSSMGALEVFMRQMSPEEAAEKLNAASEFLLSSASTPYRQGQFVREMSEVLMAAGDSQTASGSKAKGAASYDPPSA